ncbi:hypothetical protein DENSPDRAFT_303544 [Dentipellis sp. KUC8613]|nr:hypothetical protein DENSPDRAFT_303544 [Dentipellis sp. KUC8613]
MCTRRNFLVEQPRDERMEATSIRPRSILWSAGRGCSEGGTSRTHHQATPVPGAERQWNSNILKSWHSVAIVGHALVGPRRQGCLFLVWISSPTFT